MKPFLLLLAFLATAAACSDHPTCSESCGQAVRSLLDAAREAGAQVDGAEDRAHEAVDACVRTCGGDYAVSRLPESLPPPARCSGWRAEPGAEPGAESGTKPRAWPGTEPRAESGTEPRAEPGTEPGCLVLEPRCAALAGDFAACLRIQAGEDRDDCLSNAHLREAVAEGKADLCPAAPVARRSLCLALLGEGECAALEGHLADVCVQFRSGRPDSDPARFLLAVARNDQSLCEAVDGRDDRTSCLAALAHGVGCPELLELSADAFGTLGRSLANSGEPLAEAGRHRARSVQSEALLGLLPHVYGLLELLSLAFWLFVPWWLAGVLRRGCTSSARSSPCGAWKPGDRSKSISPGPGSPEGPWGIGGSSAGRVVCAPIGWLFLSVVGFLLVRLLAVPAAPLNFAEYGRLVPPHDHDLGGLAYSFQPLLLRPLSALLGSTLDAAFLLNAGLALLSLPALFDILLSLGLPAPAFLVVPLLAANPVFLRMSGTSAETVGFTFACLLLLGLALRARREPWAALSLPLLAAVVAAWRPEGIFVAPLLLLPAVAAAIPARGNADSARPASTWPLTVSLLVTAGVVGGFFFLRLQLPLPTVHGGLLPGHLADLLGELLAPWFFSPLLLPLALAASWAGLAWRREQGAPRLGDRISAAAVAAEVLPGALPGNGGLCVAPAGEVARIEAEPVGGGTRSAGRTALAVVAASSAASSIVLLVLWTVQGVEKNLAFGTARYAVALLPWLLVPVSMASGRWPGIARGGAVVLALSFVPQLPLVWKQAETQDEFRFLRQAVSMLPDGAVVAVPSAPAGEDEFTPEAAAAAVIEDSGRALSWLSLEQAGSRPSLLGGRVAFVLQGRYPGCADLDAVARRCRLEPVLEIERSSVPDSELFPSDCDASTSPAGTSRRNDATLTESVAADGRHTYLLARISCSPEPD